MINITKADLDKIRAFYKVSREITLADAHKIIKSGKRKIFQPNEYILKEGSYDKNVYLIRKGIVRVFQVNDKGEEITTHLRWENHIVVNHDLVLFNEAYSCYLQALERTELLSIDYDLLQSIIEKNPKLERNRKFLLRSIIKEMYFRINSFVLLSPEERYLKYIEDNPDVINRVPNKYIANVLGITPVSLSRIRKRIAERKA